MTTKLSIRQEKIKQREGDRLKRSLRSLFGGIDFGFFWTNDQTSYTNGKDIWVKYDIQTPAHRPFTPEECRVLRKSHGIHERGHIEFDYLEDYIQWQKDNVSTKLEDWKDNKLYPAKWLKFFGNMSLDGRMENFVVLKLPSYKDYVDFSNYEWRFGIRGKSIGENPVVDFQDCYSSRVLGMTDLDDWLPEAVELVESVQEKIDELRFAGSTKECLIIVSDIMKEVWPQLIEWMDLNNMEKDTPPSDYSGDSHEEGQQWGEQNETSENSQRVLVAVKVAKKSDKESSKKGNTEEGKDSPSDSTVKEDDSSDETTNQPTNSESGERDSSSSDNTEDDIQSKQPDFSHIIKIEEKQMNKDEKAIDEEVQDFASRTESVEIEIPDKKKRLNEKVVVKPYRRKDTNQYLSSLSDVKRLIKPTSKALRELLEGEQDSVRRNVRSGRFMPNRAWKAVHCNDNNVFQKNRKGTPKSNAFVALQADISGSTYSQLESGTLVIQEIQKAMQLLLEACVEAGVPSTAHAFTESDDTIIYPIKPNPHRYGDEEKGYLGALVPEYGNRDTLALQWSVDQIAMRNEDIRLIIMLSDGLPIFEPEENPQTIRNMVEKAEKQGIDVLCLFVGDPQQHVMNVVKEMYPGRAIFADRNIARELQKHVKRIIRLRRK